MMTRSLYENVDLERFRRHHYSMQQWDQRNTALEMSHAERLQIRSAPTCRPERVSSDNEQDSRDGSSQNRRQRIAVACARCRKRKIKCSGDPGNGMGCQNCRNAGSETCNFFRVGSHDLGTALNGQQEQQTPNTAYNGYLSHSGMGRLGYISVPGGYACSPKEYHHGHIPLSISTRSLAGSDYGLHYDTDSPTENYSLQTSPISAHDPYSGYPVPDLPSSNGRFWQTNISTQRIPTAYPHFTEQEASAGYSTSHLQYPPPAATRQALSVTDSSSSFNVLSLQYSLPNAATDRVLPNPMANTNSRSQNHAATSTVNSLNHRASILGFNGLPNHPNGSLPSAYYPKAHSTTWLPENGHETRSNSIAMVQPGPDLIAPTSSKAPTTSSASTLDSSPHSNIPNGTSPDISPTTNPISAYNPQSAAYNSSSSIRSDLVATSPHHLLSSASHHGLHDAASHPDMSIARQNPQASLYSFTRDQEPRDDRDGTLVNGEDYRPLPLPQPQPTRSQMDFARHDSRIQARKPALLRQTSIHSIHSA